MGAPFDVTRAAVKLNVKVSSVLEELFHSFGVVRRILRLLQFSLFHCTRVVVKLNVKVSSVLGGLVHPFGVVRRIHHLLQFSLFDCQLTFQTTNTGGCAMGAPFDVTRVVVKLNVKVCSVLGELVHPFGVVRRRFITVSFPLSCFLFRSSLVIVDQVEPSPSPCIWRIAYGQGLWCLVFKSGVHLGVFHITS
jgi:hypothetical protein